MDLTQIEQLVQEVADTELLPCFTRVTSRVKRDGTLITEADTAVQERLLRELAALDLEIPVLGEEMDAARQRRLLEGGTFWCLDPLDGTTNFAAGLPYFALSLALVQTGQVVAGVVYDPQRRECFSATRGGGARLNGVPLNVLPGPERLDECIALVDVKCLALKLIRELAWQPPFRSQRSFGAVALDWCWLAAGRCHLYLHGYQNLWDYAAGTLILAEAGGVACICNRPPDPCDSILRLGARPGVGAVNRPLFDAWRAFLAEV